MRTLDPWDPLSASCVHEAGHTIVGWRLGRPVIFVRASVAGASESRVKHLYDADDLLVGLAGIESERRYCELVTEGAPATTKDGRHLVWGAQTDLNEALALRTSLLTMATRPQEH